MFVPTASYRRTALFLLSALVGALLGMLGDGSAHARTSAAPATLAQAASRTHPTSLAYLGSNGQLFVSNLTGSRRHQLTFGPNRPQWQPRWGPFGSKILYVRCPNSVCNELWLIRANGRNNHLLRAFSAQQEISDMAWAPGSGRIALVMNGDIFIYTPRTDTLTPLHVKKEPDRIPTTVDWSHDGRRIAFSAINYSSGNADYPGDLYTIAPDGSGLQQVNNDGSVDDRHPRWSPDDSRLLFRRYGDVEGCSLWIVNAAADGTDLMRVRGACYSRLANWSPNGRRIVVEKYNNKSRRWEVWTMALDGTRREFIAPGTSGSYRPPS